MFDMLAQWQFVTFLKRKFEIAIMNFNDFASMECHGIFNEFLVAIN